MTCAWAQIYRVQFQAVGLVSAIDAELGRVVIRAAGRTFELPANMVQKSTDAPAYQVFEDLLLVNRCADDAALCEAAPLMQGSPEEDEDW